jgi:4-hydroxythreonine-4-phosphate dehydrogenase
MTLPLIVTAGDPAGVGPEVAVRAAHHLAVRAPVVLVGSARQLAVIAHQHALAICWEPYAGQGVVSRNRIGVVDVGDIPEHVTCARAPTAEGGAHQLRVLQTAVRIMQAGQGRALVTGPVSKAAVCMSGVPFTGHTEYLALQAGMNHDDVTMMFWGPMLRVALVTTHCSIRSAPGEVTAHRVERTLRHMIQAITAQRTRESTREHVVADLRVNERTVIVTGLNPHAGEGGLLGTEERAIIEPAVQAVRSQLEVVCTQVRVVGPVAAETAFRQAAGRDDCCVVTMLHDQATIASKLLDWERAVNVTWGLPYIRTSVDHGVAYDAAGTDAVSEQGMMAAMELALRWSPRASPQGHGEHGSGGKQGG